MKTVTLAIALLSGVLTSYGQLSGNASYLKKAFPTTYENTIKRHAIDKWGGNHSMVVYEISKQADAMTELVNTFESKNTREVVSAIRKWTISGFSDRNEVELEQLKTMDRKSLIQLHCNWNMVVYEYKKQVKAKNLY